MSEGDGTCEECEFFVPKQEGKVWNECHRFPPRRSDSGTRLFAPVYATDWCGEFVAAPLVEKKDINEAIQEVNATTGKGKKRG